MGDADRKAEFGARRRATLNNRVGCRGNGGAHEFAGTRNLVNLLLAHCGTARLSFLYLSIPAPCRAFDSIDCAVDDFY